MALLLPSHINQHWIGFMKISGTELLALNWIVCCINNIVEMTFSSDIGIGVESKMRGGGGRPRATPLAPPLYVAYSKHAKLDIVAVWLYQFDKHMHAMHVILAHRHTCSTSLKKWEWPGD